MEERQTNFDFTPTQQRLVAAQWKCKVCGANMHYVKGKHVTDLETGKPTQLPDFLGCTNFSITNCRYATTLLIRLTQRRGSYFQSGKSCLNNELMMT
jgi:rubredoxin